MCHYSLLWNWKYFLVWLFIWIFYYFNSVKCKIASKSVCTRNAALNSQVWWSTSSLSFLTFFEAFVINEDTFSFAFRIFSFNSSLCFYFFVEKGSYTWKWKINSSEKRDSLCTPVTFWEMYFLRQHSITNFLSWKRNIFISFFLC